MLKICENCQAPYKSKDRRQKTCSKACGAIKRKSTPRKITMSTSSVVVSSARPPSASLFDLPPPEELPAPYAKRVHDMWAALTGNGDITTRIA